MTKWYFKQYSLPEEVRDKLTEISDGFYTLKDYGMWFHPIHEYGTDAIAVLRTRSALSYDVSIPTIINMMREGILTAVFPVGMKVMDVVFYQFDKDNLFHNSAYYRAKLKIIQNTLVTQTTNRFYTFFIAIESFKYSYDICVLQVRVGGENT